MTVRHRQRRIRKSFVGVGAACLVTATAVALISSSPARSQGRKVPCASPESQNLVLPPVLDRSATGNVLEGTIVLQEQFRRLPPAQPGATDCYGDLLRFFAGIKADDKPLELPPSATPPVPDYTDASPGPTLRARVGDLVKLKFINEVNGNRFDSNVDIDTCMTVGQNGRIYPGAGEARFDKPPNCLHASSTANIHFHGTHTNPNSVGDNVFVQLRPLPRNNQGVLTTSPAEATSLFKDFLDVCTEKLKDPLSRWPATWADVRKDVGNNGAKPVWVDQQEKLLQTYQQDTGQPLWDRDQAEMSKNLWPPYYIGAYPYCFTMPAYTAAVFPPPHGSTSPMMGQAPGTHWYHAHKHGSTAINVLNGMTGAFIVEGKYDDDLNAMYKGYMLEGNREWNTRNQPVMVLNQLGDYPNLLRGTTGTRPTAPAVSVNGRAAPLVPMQPGEIQLWRIINTSGRSAVFLMPPTDGLQWMQAAQDGVQLANDNLQKSLNRPFYLAPGNRIDLLVKAPLAVQATPINVRYQDVMSRADVVPNPAIASTRVLMSANVSGQAVTLDGKPVEMPFPRRAPDFPVFLQDITDAEWAKSNYRAQSLIFDSGTQKGPAQHTINNIQFENGQAHVDVQLGNVEEWTIKNATNTPGSIDHPFHIHINPFQITEIFIPKDTVPDPDNAGGRIPKYIFYNEPKTGQCYLNPNDPDSWTKGTGACAPTKIPPPRIWWDVFAIPTGLGATDKSNNPINGTDGKQIVVPGYFKMRSRFVDFPGQYVLHCHILIHEDRGMMFSVGVSAGKPTHYH